MEKVYLLLRNNNVSGPYSIDELLQQQLAPTDLIWIEGRSVAWCFPSQIRELNRDFEKIISSLQENGTKPPQPVAYSRTEQSFDQRVEAIRNRALAYSYQSSLMQARPLHQEAGTAAEFNPVPNDVKLVYHARRKYVTLPQLAASAMITAMVAWAWYSGWSPVKEKSYSEQDAVMPITKTATAAHAAKFAIVRDTVAAEAPEQILTEAAAPVYSGRPIAADDTGSAQAFVPQEAIATAVAAPEKEGNPVLLEETKKEPLSPPVKAEEKTETKAEDITTEDADKKKSLGQVIKGIFRKKKKDKEEEPNE